jgi:NTE family protein
MGAFEVGVVEAMARRGMTPDLLVGSSVGALNAAFWAFKPGPDAGDELLQAWLDAARQRLWFENPGRWLIRFLTRHDHLVGHAAEARLIDKHLGAGTQIEEATIPLAIVATDSLTGRPMALRSGDLGEALLGSMAIPGLFAPVRFKDHLLIDGGVLANCAVEAARELGADRAIVVDPICVSGSRPAGRGLIAEFERAVAISLRRQTDLAIAALDDRLEITLLRPSAGFSSHLFDFSRTRELFEMGRAAAYEALNGLELRGADRSRGGGSS